MAINKTLMGRMRKELHSYQLKRREMIRESGDALHHAKRAIFSIHRDNLKEAEKKIKECEVIFKKLHTKFKNDKKILNEGSYKAAVEEYVEASIFYQFVKTGKITEIKSFKIDSDVFLAGLCDVPGELYRYAIKSATKRDAKMVRKCADAAGDIVGELIEFNLTSYLRNKFDQAKQANQKIERVVYDISLRD